MPTGQGTAGIAPKRDVGNYDADGKLKVAPGVPLSGGWDVFCSIDLDEAPVEIKGEAGVLAGMKIMNMSASVLYLKVYNASGAEVTVGTTSPRQTLVIPTLGTTKGNGFSVNFGNQGIGYHGGITVAVTTGLFPEDVGAPGDNEVVANIWYK
jgi:hypothetical protein